MNETVENALIAALKKKYDLLSELLRVTNLVELSGENDKYEREAQDYIFLIEKRGYMIENIEKINDEIKSINRKNSDLAPNEIVKELEKNIHALIEKIIDIDNKNIIKANNIFDKIKGSIKNIKMGRNINSAYQSDYGMLTGGLFDRSN